MSKVKGMRHLKIAISIFIPLVLFVGFIGSTILSKMSDSASSVQSAASEAKDEEKVYGTEEPVMVGEVKWIVGRPEKKDVIESKNEYDDPVKPGGVFVVVPIDAELLGKESGTIDASQFALIDSKGRKFEPSNDIAVNLKYLNEKIFMKQIHPDIPIKGVIVFDVAKDSKELKLEIKDFRAFSSSPNGYVWLGM